MKKFKSEVLASLHEMMQGFYNNDLISHEQMQAYEEQCYEPQPVEVQITSDSADELILPQYQTAGSAGMDVHSTTDVVLNPQEVILIPTGFKTAIPEGYEIQVRARSGLATKHLITLPTGVSTIDCDWRGAWKIPLVNLGKEPYTIHRGDRIAQMVLAPVARCEWKKVKELPQTERDEGGFGSTQGF